jgi:ABC-type sugar transport system ATPase subunit
MSETREPILTARNLNKHFGRVVALDNADFDLYRGEILAVIGDNGAGKTTLIKAICGAIAPDSGEITLEGKRVHFNSQTTCFSVASCANPVSSDNGSACSTTPPWRNRPATSSPSSVS